MEQPPIPDDEAKRLELLRACHILYTPAEEAFDDVARLAAEICGTEIALITLVDAEQQWFKARVGIEQTTVARDLSFCGHCIVGRDALIVEDTLKDPRFADNPLVTGEPGIRFYAGVPLEVDEGSSVGALSVADRSPRTLPTRHLESLRRLARQISRELRLRRDLHRVRDTVPPSRLTIAPGSVVDGLYRITREIGRGSVGAVFEANDTNDRRVAIKVLLPEWRSQEHVLERFAREARVLMRLNSPHVGRLLGVGNLGVEQGDLPYLVLEYLEGLDLEQLVCRDGPLEFRRAFAWCADACDGVAEAHDCGVVHRDLKPSNIFLAEGAAGETVKVLDFGIAAVDSARDGSVRLTAVDYLLGSPAYMSPEQMVSSSDVDARSDVWSMGALLYELVTGQLPFPGETYLQMFAAAMTRPPLPLRAHLKEKVPGEVERVLLKCMRKKREDRYPSIRSLAIALREIAAA